MPEQGKKLTIIVGTYSGKKAIFDEGKKIEVPFNPSEYSVDKSNSFSEATIPGLGSPIIQFTSGNTKTLSLELLLDTQAYDDGEDIRRKYIDKLEKLVEIDGELHAPPPCKVIWGTFEFVGVLDSLGKRYVLFLDDGTPVRARVTLSFKEYVPVEIQVRETPRSSPDRFKRHLIKEGDSLWYLSYKHYGEPGQWRVIADANKIDNPRILGAGEEIVVPPLEKK
jgi:hypothetical protein